MSADVLKSRPWVGFTPPTDLSAPRGMVGPDERACYYWLARYFAEGRGAIVDAGCFLGASTFAFAAGAADAGRRQWNGGPLVHAYDYFQVIDEYVGQAISAEVRPIGDGESYLDIFQAQTAPYADMIAPHGGDFLGHRWSGDPVEILFIDVAKTRALNCHVVKEFFPALIPDHSIVVQQDYFHCWHPHIHIGMEYLADEFDLLDECVPYQSAVSRLARPIPQHKIDTLAAYRLNRPYRLRLLDRVIEKSSPDMQPMLRVVRIWEQITTGALDGARADMAALRRDYDIDTRPELWARQALEVETQL